VSKRARIWSAILAHKFGVAMLVVALVVKMAIFLGDDNARQAGGDGHYSWLYARSLAFDHDIEFTNDYAMCGDPWRLGHNRGTGHPDNPFYAGPSLFFVPVLEIARAVYPMPASASDNDRLGCQGSPLMAITLGTSVMVGMATMVLCYLLALRFARDGIAALATLVIGMGSPHLPFAAVFVGYTLVYCGFGVAFYTWLLVRAHERPTLLRWGAVGLGLGLAAFQRLPLIEYGLVALVVAAVQFRNDRRLVPLGRGTARNFAARFALEGGKIPSLTHSSASLHFQSHFVPSALRHLVTVLALLAVGTLVGLLPIFAIYKYLYGTIFAVPQGRHYIHLSHAHPFLVLFGTHGGLFFQSPIVWLAVLGVPFLGRVSHFRAFVLALIVASLIDLWIASSSLDYHSAWTYGARRLTTWMPIMVILASLALGAAVRWLKQREGRALRVLGVVSGGLLTATFASWVFAYTRHVVPGAAALTQEQAYGTGPAQVYALLDKTGISPAILPGQLWYWARYRLPLVGYGQTIDPVWYKRNYGTLHVEADEIPVHSAEIKRQIRGFVQTSEGLSLTGAQGRLVFSAEWPFATHFAIRAHANRDCWLRVGGGRWFGRANFFDRVHLTGGQSQSLRILIPKSEFDSGLNEFVFQPDGGSCGVVLESIRILDETNYPPSY
jgi:hypothetical protein